MLLAAAILCGLLIVSGGPVEAQVLWIETGYHVWTDDTPYHSEVFLQNDTTLDVVGGAMGQLTTGGNSVANLSGGDITHLWTMDNSVVHYHSGELERVGATHSGLMFLYAYDVTYYPVGGLEDRGYVEGFFYENDEPFTFSFRNTQSWEHIEIVPEPATFLLLGLGAVVTRKQSRI